MRFTKLSSNVFRETTPFEKNCKAHVFAIGRNIFKPPELEFQKKRLCYNIWVKLRNVQDIPTQGRGCKVMGGEISDPIEKPCKPIQQFLQSLNREEKVVQKWYLLKQYDYILNQAYLPFISFYIFPN